MSNIPTAPAFYERTLDALDSASVCCKAPHNRRRWSSLLGLTATRRKSPKRN